MNSKNKPGYTWDDAVPTHMWEAYQSTKSVALRNEIALQYGELVKAVCRSMSFPFWMWDELLQEGQIMLLELIELYDVHHESKARFSTFAFAKLGRTLRKTARGMGYALRVPPAKALLLSKLQRKRRLLASVNGRTPTDQELADGLEITLRALEELLQTERRLMVLSLDHEIDGHDDLKEWVDVEQERLQDVLVDRLFCQQTLEQAEEVLTERQYEFLLLISQGKPQAEIARELGISDGRASELKLIIRERVRHLFSDQHGIGLF